MSRADDRIPVPGNGHGPPIDAPVPDTARAPDRAAAAAPESAVSEPTAPDPTAPEPAVVVRPETTVVFTPGQLAVGFGIVASIILFVVGRRRRRR